MSASDYRAAWYFNGGDKQAARITKVHSPTIVTVQLGDATHRAAVPFIEGGGPTPSGEYATPGPDVDLDALERSIAAAKGHRDEPDPSDNGDDDGA